VGKLDRPVDLCAASVRQYERILARCPVDMLRIIGCAGVRGRCGDRSGEERGSWAKSA
jgi:hypothetical protein